MERIKKESNIFSQKFKAIIFDLDGVIVDSDFAHEKAKVETLKHFGFKIERKKWQTIKNYSISQIHDLLNDGTQSREVKKEVFVKYKRNLFFEKAVADITLIPGALDFVKSLKKRNIRLALVTAGARETFKVFSKKFDFEKYFEIILTGDDVTKLKPDPEAYIKALGLLNLKPTDCLVVEDNEVGVRSGKSAGCQVLGRVGTMAEDDLIRSGADVTFEDFSKLLGKF